MEREVRYCTTEDGVTLAYGTLGSGPPLIVPVSFLSGLGFPGEVDGFYWWDQALSRSFAVTRYDGRGMGLSDRTPADYSLEARVRDLGAVISAVGAERFSLFAASYANFAAITFAARNPHRVESLVLWGGAADGSHIYETDWGKFADATTSLTVDQWQFISEAILARAMPGVSSDVIAARGAMFRASWRADDVLAFREANRSIDVTQSLPLVRVPTLVVHSASPGASLEDSRLMASRIPGARLLQSAVGHAFSAPDRRMRDEVMRFLGSTLEDLDETPAAAPTSGVRTVLFTDLVGHTEMMQRLGDARGRELLREHERITRETLLQHGGHEVKTMGDGFMASFGSVTAAVECAAALQRAFAAWNDSTGASSAAPLHVRVGLNAGEPIEDEGDLFGATVILASRVAAQAEAGQILIPEPVRHLLAGKGHAFADHGEFLPKGFEDTVRLYEVRWRD